MLPRFSLCSWNDDGEPKVPYKNKVRILYLRTFGRETYGVRCMLVRALRVGNGVLILTSRVVLDSHFTCASLEAFI